MKLRTASESVGWLNSVGPLAISPTPSAVLPVPEAFDLVAIKARWLHGYTDHPTDIEAFRAASRDVRRLFEEVERLTQGAQ